MVVPVLAFVVAFALDVGTDRRFSQVWGSFALLASAAAIPVVRRAVVPVAAYLGVWVGFNSLRAIGDNAGLGPVPQRLVAELEARLFGGVLPSALAQRTVLDPTHVGPIQLAITTVYLSFFVVPHVVAITLLVRERALFWRMVVASALLFGCGVATFALAPTAPPWMAAADDPSLGVVDRLPRLVLGDLGVAFDQASHSSPGYGYGFEPNPLASMPSIHLGVTVLIALVAWQGRTLWRWLASAYAVAMGIALVASGEHYVVDVIAGAILAGAAWASARRLLMWNSVSANASGAPPQYESRPVPEVRPVTDRSSS